MKSERKKDPESETLYSKHTSFDFLWGEERLFRVRKAGSRRSWFGEGLCFGMAYMFKGMSWDGRNFKRLSLLKVTNTLGMTPLEMINLFSWNTG